LLKEKGHLADSVIRQVALDFVLVRRLDGAGNNQSDERDDQEKPIHITVTGKRPSSGETLANDLVPNQRSLEGIFMQANTFIKRKNTEPPIFWFVRLRASPLLPMAYQAPLRPAN